MSEASDLIERMEKETGRRVDDNGGDNIAMAGLFGALARAMGHSAHSPRDDVAAGILVRHQVTPEYEAEQRSRRMMAEMLAGGMPPDVLSDLLGRK